MLQTSRRGLAAPTCYPPLRLEDLQLFTEEPKRPFRFDDVQAATGFDLADGRKALTMLRAAGLIERIQPHSQMAKPWYRVTQSLEELLRLGGAPISDVRAVTVAALRSYIDGHNGKGLPVKIDRINLVTSVSLMGNAMQILEGEVVLQTKRDVSDELVRVAKELRTLFGCQVSLVLEWKLGHL